MSSSSGGLSWRATALSILAGCGVGYMVGVLTARWWWWGRERRRRRGSGRSEGGNAGPSQSSSSVGDSSLSQTTHADLATALTELTSQVESVQSAVSEILHYMRRRGQRRDVTATSAGSMTSDFLSARPDYPSDDEFFDLEAREDEEEEGKDGDVEDKDVKHFDELGKRTLESEEACQALVKELKGRLAVSPDEVWLLWRLSRALVHLSIHSLQQGNTPHQEKELLVEATEHAQRALDLDDRVWQCHQWYAIALGSQIKHEGTQRKITGGYEYKEHIDTAISLNPNEPSLFYLRGRWGFEVAGLSWLEKKAAAALFATPPEATFEEAMADFMRVESMDGAGTWKANLLMVAKCHHMLKDLDAAMNWVQKSLQLRAVTSEDKTAQKEAEEFVAKLETELSYY